MTRTDGYLSYADQAMLLTLRGAAHEAVIQALWLYPQLADLDGLVLLHRRLAQGRLGRRIETSRLPFGRHRWVAAEGTPFTVDRGSIARDCLYDWADRQVDQQLDPVSGPPWRLSATRTRDGGTVVSLVVSHCIADGTATAQALVAAATGTPSPASHAHPGSRGAAAVAWSDLRRLGADLPDVGRALKAAARALRAQPAAGGQTPAPDPPAGAPRTLHLPTASLIADVEAWEARAKELRGNRFALAAAVAAHLGAAFGRAQAGSVMLLVPVSARDDDQPGGTPDGNPDGTLDANVVSLAHVPVPTSGLASDLTALRDALRTGIADARDQPDPMMELLPLVPFVPRRAIGALADRAFGFGSDLPVSVSNMGVLSADILRADGTPAESLLFRGVDRHLSAANLARRRGVLSVFTGAVGGQWTLTTSGSRPDATTTSADLRAALRRAVADLGAPGTII